jgi:hypothetical protein
VYDRTTVLDDLIEHLEGRGKFCDCEVPLNALDGSRRVLRGPGPVLRATESRQLRRGA